MRFVFFILLSINGYINSINAVSHTTSRVVTSVEPSSKKIFSPSALNKGLLIPQDFVQKHPKLFLARNSLFVAAQTMGVVWQIFFMKGIIDRANGINPATNKKRGYDRGDKILTSIFSLTSFTLLCSAIYTLVDTITLYNKNKIHKNLNN